MKIKQVIECTQEEYSYFIDNCIDRCLEATPEFLSSVKEVLSIDEDIEIRWCSNSFIMAFPETQDRDSTQIKVRPLRIRVFSKKTCEGIHDFYGDHMLYLELI